MTWLVIPIGIVLFLLLSHLLTRSNTRLGKVLRASDHQAWLYAVEDKEQELAELKAHEPRQG